MKKNFNNFKVPSLGGVRGGRSILAGALMCAAALFTVVACEKDEENPKPGKAGISVVNEADNVCGTEAEPFVILGVTAENATSYKWYKNGTALSSTGTGEVLTVSESGTYTAAGVNDQGEGAVSDAKIVTIADCGAPVITGDEHNACPTETVELSIEAIANATSYQWYNGATKIDGATATTYTVTEPGTYTVAGVYVSGEGAKSAPKVVNITTCAGEAGTINGAVRNACPEVTVELTIGAIPNATSYKWYKDDAPIDGATATTYTVTEPGTYTVAGVNSESIEGTRSEAKVVNITPCVGAAGTIDGLTENVCPEETVTLTIDEIANATSYQWYKDGDPISGATTTVYVVELIEPYTGVPQSGNYTVKGVNDDREEGDPSPVHRVTITLCKPDKPQAVHITSNPNALSATNCSPSGGTTTVQLSGNISPRATSYTWYITKTLGGIPEELHTYDYDSNDPASALHWDAVETGTYTTTGSNEYGESDHSFGFYVEIKSVGDCTPTATPTEAPGNFRISTGDASKVQNGDGSWSNVCENYATNLMLSWDAVNGAGSYIVKNLTAGTETVRSSSQRTLQVTLGNSGTYTVRVRNAVGDGPESDPIAIRIMECPLGAPAFVGYTNPPSANTCPATNVLVGVQSVSNASSYSIYKDGSTTAVDTQTPVDAWSDVTFTVTETGAYTVRAISASGMEGTPTNEFTVTINSSCPSAPTGTSDFTGTWDVADLKVAIPFGTEPWTYQVTIAEGSGNITIANFADKDAGGATVNATIDLTGDGSKYGTITIPEQPVTTYGGGTVDATFSKMTSSLWGGTSYGGDVTADIVSVGGKLYFKLKDKFAIKSGDDILVSSEANNTNSLAAFTKQ
jgi:hypothetical protein